MNFAATEDHELLRQAVREFVEKEARPTAAARDEAMEWPADLVKHMGQLGFLGVEVGEEYGGAGLDYISYAIVIEELSRVDASLGVIASVNNSLVCHGLERFGTDEQKRDDGLALSNALAVLASHAQPAQAEAIVADCDRLGIALDVSAQCVDPMLPAARPLASSGAGVGALWWASTQARLR